MEQAVSTKIRKMKAEAPYIMLLRQQLELKLRERWQVHYSILGPSLDQISSRNALYEMMREDINQVNLANLGKRRAEKITISKDTLRRLMSLDEADSERGFYGPTKEAVAHYLGYKGWGDFRQRHTPLHHNGHGELHL